MAYAFDLDGHGQRLTLLVAITYVVVRDGPPAGYSRAVVIGIMAFFWAGGIGLVAFVLPEAVRPCHGGRDTRVSATWLTAIMPTASRFQILEGRPSA